ncbi:hypothetical protein M3Y97_00398000 [Aphelenchoides bicaudatus]|nr:hypothetical protein M3Y97_00398000 [Aphelenchoides bicaudatus]
MAEVENTPDPIVEEKPENSEPVASTAEEDKEPDETESKASKDGGKETVLDVFKKFAGASQMNWADMVLEEAIQHETAQKNAKMDRINDEISSFKEPFIIYVSNIPGITAEEVYMIFGGENKVADFFLFEDREGQALVEFKDKSSLADALMLNDEIFFKKKINVEYVDACQSMCYKIPSERPPQPVLQPNDRTPMNRINNGAGNRNRTNRGPLEHNQRRQPYNDINNETGHRNRTNRGPPPEQHNQRRHPYSDANNEPIQRNPINRVPPVEQAPRKNPFGNAKAVDTSEKMREIQKKIESEAKQPVQKKQSVSSQQSQQLSETQSVDEAKPPTSEPKPLAEAVVEPEKKPHNTNAHPSSKRRIQHQRSDYSSSSHSRGNQKINVQQVQKFLGMSHKSLNEAGKEDRKKGRDGGSEADSSNTERRHPKHRYSNRKDSSATNRSTGGHKEVHKQLSNEKPKSPTRPAPIDPVPENPPHTAESAPAVDSASPVSTPTTTEPPSGTNPATTKSKKSKSSKKKKNSNAGVPNNSMFAALSELRE